MRIISVEKKMADELCSLDSEMLLNKSGRPCLLMLRLKYKGRKVDFAVPFRSNIPPAEQKSNYFALPPRHTTRPKHRHGLHFSKMFPIRKQYLQKYHIDDNPAMLRAEQKMKSKLLCKRKHIWIITARAAAQSTPRILTCCWLFWTSWTCRRPNRLFFQFIQR